MPVQTHKEQIIDLTNVGSLNDMHGYMSCKDNLIEAFNMITNGTISNLTTDNNTTKAINNTHLGNIENASLDTTIKKYKVLVSAVIYMKKDSEIPYRVTREKTVSLATLKKYRYENFGSRFSLQALEKEQKGSKTSAEDYKKQGEKIRARFPYMQYCVLSELKNHRKEEFRK